MIPICSYELVDLMVILSVTIGIHFAITLNNSVEIGIGAQVTMKKMDSGMLC